MFTGVGSKFMNSSTGARVVVQEENRMGGGTMQQQQQQVKRPMRKMSMTQSQSPVSSPVRNETQQQQVVDISPPSSPINVVAHSGRGSQPVRARESVGRSNFSSSLPSPLEQEQAQQRQQQFGEEEDPGVEEVMQELGQAGTRQGRGAVGGRRGGGGEGGRGRGRQQPVQPAQSGEEG